MLTRKENQNFRINNNFRETENELMFYTLMESLLKKMSEPEVRETKETLSIYHLNLYLNEYFTKFKLNEKYELLKKKLDKFNNWILLDIKFNTYQNETSAEFFYKTKHQVLLSDFVENSSHPTKIFVENRNNQIVVDSSNNSLSKFVLNEGELIQEIFEDIIKIENELDCSINNNHFYSLYNSEIYIPISDYTYYGLFFKKLASGTYTNLQFPFDIENFHNRYFKNQNFEDLLKLTKNYNDDIAKRISLDINSLNPFYRERIKK